MPKFFKILAVANHFGKAPKKDEAKHSSANSILPDWMRQQLISKRESNKWDFA